MSLWQRFWDRLFPMPDAPMSCHCWEVHDLGGGWVREGTVSEVKHHHWTCSSRERD